MTKFAEGMKVQTTKGNKETGGFKATVVRMSESDTVGKIVIVQKSNGSVVWCRPDNLTLVGKTTTKKAKSSRKR